MKKKNSLKKVDISIQNISKIEGHADIDVKVREGKVKNVKIKFTDNKRFFTQAIRGQSIDMLPQSVARICGTCSIAHTMCCIEAIEKALKIEPSPQTKLLKKLTMYALMIRDHALHVYLFSLPDVFGKDSVLDFSGNETQYLQDAFDIKRVGNKLATIVAGRAVHAPYPQVGGFVKIPDNKELKALLPELKSVREKVLKVMEVYYNCKVDYTRDTNFVALGGADFDFLGNYISNSKGEKIPEEDYLVYLEKHVTPYSQAVGYKFEGDTYLVGALARINLFKNSLNENTKKDASKYLSVFPSKNIFHNTLAQAIEILHCIDQSIDIIEKTEFKEESLPKIEYKESVGVGVIEAPRGLLYYKLFINSEGVVKQGNIITPSQQNQVNMELDIKELVQKNLKTLSKKQIEYEMEKLIRAYDPCISCATHFLKVNWK